MKIKDIEKNLKKEGERVVVPDVYARVKKAPINRLLSDPVHAFQSKMVMRMLFFTVAILLVVAISVSAIWLTPDQTSEVEFGYLRITVNGDTVYGFAVDSEGTVLAALTEKTNGADAYVPHPNCVKKPLEDAIALVYASVNGDAVTVSSQFDNNDTATLIAKEASSIIEIQGAGVTVTRLVCDEETRISFVQYINSRASTSLTVNFMMLDLTRYYVAVAGA
ncbi:MAG: hypothetical protein IK048_05480 [Clostridia bacterium]|nr:hypothetical protein [Clostridia bacterium]